MRLSTLLARLVRRARGEERRWEEILASIGAIPDQGHEWDEDPAAWVRGQRRGDPDRVG
jgi:hypothetical protein